MAYIEEPQSKLEQAIGRRLPLALAIVFATCWAAWMNFAGLAEGLLAILAAIGVSYFQSLATEKQNAQVLRQETATEVKNG